MRSSSYQDRDGADHTALNAGQAQIRSFPTAFNFPPAKSRGRKSNRLSPRCKLATSASPAGSASVCHDDVHTTSTKRRAQIV